MSVDRAVSIILDKNHTTKARGVYFIVKLSSIVFIIHKKLYNLITKNRKNRNKTLVIARQNSHLIFF